VIAAIAINNTRASIPNLIIANSDSLRYNVFSGAFDKNDQITSSPFTDYFLYIPNIELNIANDVLSSLNSDDDRRRSLRSDESLRRQEAMDKRYDQWLEEMAKRSGLEGRATTNLTLGYVTSDSCPGVGDDTAHTALPYYSTPEYIASDAPDVSGTTKIDLVFIDFIESDVISILNSVQSSTTYTTSDVQTYSPVEVDAVLGIYAQSNWN